MICLNKKELRKLSKNELIAMILLRDERIAVFETRLKKIEALLKQHQNPNTPSSKQRFKENTKDKEDNNTENNQEEKEKKPRFPGRPKDHEGAGIKIPEADKIEEHTISNESYTVVGERVKHVIDFVDLPIIVTKHIIYQYLTPEGNTVEPDVNLPDGVYGNNLKALAALLKGRIGASYEGISDFVKGLRPDLTLCSATALNMIYSLSNDLAPERQKILDEIRLQFWCHGDETGFRQDGRNGYAWGFSTPTLALYEYNATRCKEVAENILGKDNDIIVVCDGYAGYNNYRRQRCWPHLMRGVDALAEENKEVKPHANYFRKILYRKALAAKEKPPDERERLIGVMNGVGELGFMLESLAKIPGCSETVTKIENAREHLFTGVRHPEIPLDNNHEERLLRKLVLHRNNMGCIRNHKGELFINNLMSVLQTWKLQGKNQYQELKKVAG